MIFAVLFGLFLALWAVIIVCFIAAQLKRTKRSAYPVMADRQSLDYPTEYNAR